MSRRRSGFGISVSVEYDGGGATVITEGELDRASATVFDERLDEVVEAGCSPLTVDLSRISFADVAGYRAMARLSERCARRGLVNMWLRPSPPVQLLWRILGPPGGAALDCGSTIGATVARNGRRRGLVS
jgi:anti-anti-sigma factor